MSGKSTLAMHPHMEAAMRSLGCEDLMQMSRRTGIPYTTLRNWAYDGDFQNASLLNVKRLSRSLGISIDELVSRFDTESPS